MMFWMDLRSSDTWSTGEDIQENPGISYMIFDVLKTTVRDLSSPMFIYDI